MTFYHYFQSHMAYFWTWEEDADVISVPGGSTIAYRAYIAEVLSILKLQGIPPFGSLLLAIVATNKNAGPAIDHIEEILKAQLRSQGTEENAEPEFFENCIAFMRLLAKLPANYKSAENRHFLFQWLFADCHNIISKKNAEAIVNNLTKVQYSTSTLATPVAFSHDCFYREFRVLAILSAKYPTVESIIGKMAELPDVGRVELEDEPQQDGQPKDFVSELTDNIRTFHVGSLIRRIWTGLNIPYHHSLPSEQPLGGVSDLTNKGDFDKLLISEFANDDLMFMSRLANNEALYIRREVPPSNDTSHRIILVDSTLKNWGNCHTIAFAVMVAIARHPKTDIACDVYVLGGNTFTALQTDSIDNIIHGLGKLDIALHPARALDTFMKGIKDVKNPDLIYISGEEAFDHAEMRRVFAEHAAHFRYLILTNEQGGIACYKYHNKNRKLLQQFTLPLKDAWTAKRTEQAYKEQLSDIDEPKTKSAYPILFPLPYSMREVLHPAENIFLAVTKDRMIFRFSVKDEKVEYNGAELLLDKTPTSTFHYSSGVNARNEILLLCFTTEKTLICYNLSTGHSAERQLDNWKNPGYYFKGFIFSNGSFYYSYGTKTWKIHFDKEIDVIEFEISKESTDRHLALKDIATSIRSRYLGKNTIRNIKDVYINSDLNLVVNNKELIFFQGNIFLREASTGVQVNSYPEDKARRERKFRDGSTIKFHKGGMMILSRDENPIDAIYIPLVLDEYLGVSTDKAFAGNGYYQKMSLGQQSVGVQVFWEDHLKPFINHIVNYAAANRS